MFTHHFLNFNRNIFKHWIWLKYVLKFSRRFYIDNHFVSKYQVIVLCWFSLVLFVFSTENLAFIFIWFVTHKLSKCQFTRPSVDFSSHEHFCFYSYSNMECESTSRVMYKRKKDTLFKWNYTQTLCLSLSRFTTAASK